ncbi:MAG: Gfo/Idh/MocA family oxidoreductase, partial [Calditrichaeota bacterium]|nr:Gfo/Idh/MocA family oxidoreductase [Calditrichota bacterium]
MSVLRWGLIGCGDIAQKRVAPALRDLPNSELVAVSRAQVERAEAFARKFGAKRWYADWRDLVADPEVDAVYIATPVFLHAEQAIEAARAGKHVLCEKPMAMNVAECDAMLAAAELNNVTLGVAYYRHLYPVILRIRELLREGAIGTPVYAEARAFERFDPPEEHPRHWLLERAKSGGGPMMDFGCHRIEVLMHLLGPVESTSGTLSNVVFKNREVEDTATAVLDFESGAQGLVLASHAAEESQDTLTIFGSEGSIRVDPLNQGTLVLQQGGATRTEHHPPHPNLHLPLIEDFVN